MSAHPSFFPWHHWPSLTPLVSCSCAYPQPLIPVLSHQLCPVSSQPKAAAPTLQLLGQPGGSSSLGLLTQVKAHNSFCSRGCWTAGAVLLLLWGCPCALCPVPVPAVLPRAGRVSQGWELPLEVSGVHQNQPVLFSPVGLGGITNMPSLTTVAPVPMASIPVVGMSPPLVSSVPAAVPPLANGAPAVIQPLPAFAHPGTLLSLSVSCS